MHNYRQILINYLIWWFWQLIYYIWYYIIVKIYVQ
jgi:hypothetical protein